MANDVHLSDACPDEHGGSTRNPEAAGACNFHLVHPACEVSAMHISGKSVLLTGAGSGLGRDLVVALTRKGCIVTACPVAHKYQLALSSAAILYVALFSQLLHLIAQSHFVIF